jgi:Secretion system C-terminal sorting domain/Outer membrane protein Omp28
MKKSLFFLFFLVSLNAIFAQAKKYPVAFHFTNSNCGSCAGNNPGFFTKLDTYAKDIHHLTVHPSTPYASCVFYQANTTENTALYQKYKGAGTPTVTFDGGKTVTSVSGVTATTLQNAFAGTSPVQVKVNENKGANRTVKATVKTVGAVPSANYLVFAAVVEKVVNQKTGNGETSHRNVFRKLLTPVAGTSFTPAAANKETVVDLSYVVDSKWNEANTYTLVWIQDGNNNILNSGTQFDVTVGTNDILENANVAVYPNPAQAELNVDLSNFENVAERISIYDLQGKEMMSTTVNQSLEKMDISALAKGQYFVKIQAKNGIFSKTFVKN